MMQAAFVFVLLLIGMACSGKCGERYTKMKQATFFNPFIQIGCAGSIPLTISIYLQLKHPLNTTVGERMGHVYGWLCFVLEFVFLPCVLIYFVSVPEEKL